MKKSNDSPFTSPGAQLLVTKMTPLPMTTFPELLKTMLMLTTAIGVVVIVPVLYDWLMIAIFSDDDDFSLDGEFLD